MNTKRMTSSLIILMLCAMCLTQTSVGCGKGKGAKDKAKTEEKTGGVPVTFAERPSTEAPGGWQAISGTVVNQLETVYQARAIKVSSLERSGTGANAVRMVLKSRAGVSEKKQMLDGLVVLYETFPAQDFYEVRIKVDSDPGVKTAWPDLIALDKAGYGFDTPANEVDQFWSKLNQVQLDSPVTAESGSGQ